MQYLSRLKNCTEITSLNLAEDIAATQDLENRHKDIFLEMIEWLRGCHQLREITLSNFISAPPLLTPVMRERGIELDSLEIEGYSLTGSKDFHQAMALQPSLTSLYLKGEDSEVVADNDILVDAINRLINLRDLRLTQISANFTEHHIRSLAQNLHKLETFWTGGFHITDAIWPDIAELGRLKRLELNADTRFTSNGIVDFVLSLGPGNEGFTLSVMMQDTDSDIAEIEQDMIRETLASRVGGRFDFLLVRGPEDEFANEDSDSESTMRKDVYSSSQAQTAPVERVRNIHYVPADFVKEQIDAVFDDIGVDVVKIGMLAAAETIGVVASTLEFHGNPPLVLDPVMVATSGAQLLPSEAVHSICTQLLPLATILTPNIPEAKLLLQKAGVVSNDVASIDDLVRMAFDIQQLGPQYVLLKGGHLPLTRSGQISYRDEDRDTVLNIFHDGKRAVFFETDYVVSKNTHGTGCSLACK
ncbi:uncharacterized protein KY384_005498 [Bacidia gigantensis]|uniref:uncharacterized protein n=1 Tax=Bacidia gigantensis TaxID=2732470 RepID=UPI001D05A5DF|nr:uncharacterized protein KY384_005498 [Bacidia gigantensis]KAG8530016.1 hypothetical protein KY384_005498 [Bacidia gigantensis]